MDRTLQGSGLIVFGMAVACSGAANAQAAGGTQRFTLEAHGRAAYESNVSGGDDTVAALRQIQPEDVTYTLGTSVGFQLPSSRQSLFLRGAVDLQRHEKNKTLDGEDYRVLAGAVRQFGICGLTVGANYARRQTLPQDLTIAVRKNTTDQSGLDTGLNCGRRGLVAGVQAAVTRVNNDATGAGFVDSETRNAAVSVGYTNAVLGDLRLSAQYSKSIYDDPPSILPMASRGFEQFGGGITYTRKIGLRLSGSAGVSYTQLESDSTGTKSSGLTADASLSYRATARTQLSLGYVLRNQPSQTINADFIRSNSLRLQASYTLNPRLSLQAGVTGARDESKGGIVTALQLRESKQFSAFAGLTYRIGRSIALNVDANYTERTADLPQFDFSSERVSVGLTSTF